MEEKESISQGYKTVSDDTKKDGNTMDDKKHTTNYSDDDELFSSSDDLFSRKDDTIADEEFNFMNDFENDSKEKSKTESFYTDDALGEDPQNQFSAEDDFSDTKKRGGSVKKMLIVIVLLIVVGGVYYLLRPSEGTEKPMKEIAFERVEKAIESVQPIVTEEAIEEMPETQRIEAFEATLTQISEQLNTLQATEQRLAKIEEVLQKLSEDAQAKGQSLEELAQVSGRMTGVATIDQRLIALEKRVQALHEEIELQTLAAARAQRSANASKQVEQAQSMQPINMVVQAAIPGRAWLLSDTGELITVTRGDEVPGYGRVVSIDPVAGTVMMSSQAVFREE